MSDNLDAFLASKNPEEEEKNEDNPEAEEAKGDWKAVDLPEVEVVTGEEGMDLIFRENAKIYRWSDNQWKERGSGTLKFLRDKQSQKVSFVMRQESTKKIVANFLIEEDPLCSLLPHAGSDKAFVWMARDLSDGELVNHKFALRLSNPQTALEFKQAFEEAKAFNICIKNGQPGNPAPVIQDA